MLHHHIGHEVAVRVALAVQPMHRREDELVHADRAVVAPDRHVVGVGPRHARPHPLLALSDGDEPYTLLGPQRRLAV